MMGLVERVLLPTNMHIEVMHTQMFTHVCNCHDRCVRMNG